MRKQKKRRRKSKVLMASGSLASDSISREIKGMDSEGSISARKEGQMFVEVEIQETIEEDEELPSQIVDTFEAEDLELSKCNFEVFDRLGLVPKQDPSLIINHLAEKLVESRAEKRLTGARKR